MSASILGAHAYDGAPGVLSKAEIAHQIRVYESSAGPLATFVLQREDGTYLSGIRLKPTDAKRIGDALVEWADERIAGLHREATD